MLSIENESGTCLDRTRKIQHLSIPFQASTLFYDSPFSLFLLLINVMVSGYALFYDQKLIDQLAFRPKRILEHKEYYRMITGGFVHGGIGHLAFNMITLFFFGPALEVILGPIRFLILFIGAELAAHALALWMHRSSPYYSAVGASGAISGVVISFAIFYPTREIYLFLIPIGFPAWIFASAFIVFSTIAMLKKTDPRKGGIAHEAHLGGAIGGLIMTLILAPSAFAVFLSQIGL